MITRLKKRAEFLAAAKAPYQARPSVVIQDLNRADETNDIRSGFTATKKIGNAVARNRAKRRLREAARLTLPQLAQPGHDYVFIARAGTSARDWQGLLDDVKAALLRLARAKTQPAIDTKAKDPKESSQEKTVL